MLIDVLVAEIGSTTTVVNAFDGIHSGKPVFLGQGQAPTSVLDGDVTIGLKGAVAALEKNINEQVSYGEMLATSSAAGGLRMTVHGLVYDMTVRAAEESALGAGAILKFVTAGKLTRTDIKKVKEINPNIILVAGGVDYGERETALNNFEKLAEQCPGIPFIYAGNVQNQDDIKLIAEEYGTQVYIVDNVYPRVDVLNVEPTRRLIHDAFEEHIVHAPGMGTIRSMIKGNIIPTPGAVLECAKILYDVLGDVIVFDVGGATTDLHSITEGSNEINEILLSPEPFAKRTVEGDLGVYVNREHIVGKVGRDELLKVFPDLDRLLAEAKAIPDTDEQIKFIEHLTKIAVHTALERHAGKLVDIYGPSGKKTYATGKDLTAIKYIVGTGGALTRLPAREQILASIAAEEQGAKLYPRKGARVLIDNCYYMASIGVLSKTYREAAIELLKRSLNL